MSHFYNYPTKGASQADQIIWLENRVIALEEERDKWIKTVNELRSMYVTVKEELDDINAAHKQVIEDRCPTDEMHCGCVTFLRREIKKLQQQIAEGTK